MQKPRPFKVGNIVRFNQKTIDFCGIQRLTKNHKVPNKWRIVSVRPVLNTWTNKTTIKVDICSVVDAEEMWYCADSELEHDREPTTRTAAQLTHKRSFVCHSRRSK